MNTIKIDVTKIDKQYLFKGKSGTYLDAVVWENRDGPDKYGFTHRIVQSVPKAEREKGVKGAIIGNLKMEAGPLPTPKTNSEPNPDDSQVPF